MHALAGECLRCGGFGASGSVRVFGAAAASPASIEAKATPPIPLALVVRNSRRVSFTWLIVLILLRWFGRGATRA